MIIEVAEAMIGPSEHERMLLAKHMGRIADEMFVKQCRQLGLDPAFALWPSPLQNIADRRARLHPHGGRA